MKYLVTDDSHYMRIKSVYWRKAFYHAPLGAIQEFDKRDLFGQIERHERAHTIPVYTASSDRVSGIDFNYVKC